eukprot:TRINITY_DN102244_c0_g1_i1.p1 TRINITY_DN102244_c0_g1~~TRINITY_DN102244_c0_g1_i1.p1  ORF type:complete len:389 (+),score=76.20 TRINITY_DN102244_c0_g1_i1:91-1257(+)
MNYSSLVLVWLAFFCDYVLMTIVIPIFPMLGASDTLTGILFASKAACQILSSPLMSKFVDHHEKLMIVVGLILESVSCLVFYCTFDYDTWMVARALSGVASAAIISAGFAHLKSQHDDADDCANAMGLAVTGIIGGVVLGPVLGGMLYELHPKLPFTAVASLELLVALAAFFFLPAEKPHAAAGGDQVRLTTMLKHPDVWRPLGALMVANAAISCLESTFARYCLETFGWSVSTVGAAYLATSVPSCFMSGISGPLGAWLGDRTLLLKVGLAMQGVFTMLGPKDNVSMEMVSLFGLGAGMGVVDGCANPVLGEVAAANFGGTGKIFVLANTFVQLGFVLGPIVGNMLVECFGFANTSVVMGGAAVAYSAFLRKPAVEANPAAEKLLVA